MTVPYEVASAYAIGMTEGASAAFAELQKSAVEGATYADAVRLVSHLTGALYENHAERTATLIDTLEVV